VGSVEYSIPALNDVFLQLTGRHIAKKHSEGGFMEKYAQHGKYLYTLETIFGRLYAIWLEFKVFLREHSRLIAALGFTPLFWLFVIGTLF
jgi:hypothetical protein